MKLHTAIVSHHNNSKLHVELYDWIGNIIKVVMFRSCSGLYMATKRWGCHNGCDEEDQAELRKAVKIKIQDS